MAEGSSPKENKEYVNESMREVAEKIDQLQEHDGQGLFTSQGRRDILTEAAWKDEYPGRTRGVIVDEAIEPSTELPKKFGNMETISDAMGGFVG
ncbi:hypothetical protein QQ045_028294 [Rhodiola kirilowii]